MNFCLRRVPLVSVRKIGIYANIYIGIFDPTMGHTISSSVSMWCNVLCTFVASDETIVITPLGLDETSIRRLSESKAVTYGGVLTIAPVM